LIWRIDVLKFIMICSDYKSVLSEEQKEALKNNKNE